jgi:hypothetical protein
MFELRRHDREFAEDTKISRIERVDSLHPVGSHRRGDLQIRKRHRS